jgi:hypothetical protein
MVKSSSLEPIRYSTVEYRNQFKLARDKLFSCGDARHVLVCCTAAVIQLHLLLLLPLLHVLSYASASAVSAHTRSLGAAASAATANAKSLLTAATSLQCQVTADGLDTLAHWTLHLLYPPLLHTFRMWTFITLLHLANSYEVLLRPFQRALQPGPWGVVRPWVEVKSQLSCWCVGR